MKIVVIGSIAAGVSAAAKLAAKDGTAHIVVYEKSAFYSCGCCGLPHYLPESLEALNAAIHSKEAELATEQVEAHLRHEVTGIDPRAHTVTVQDLTSGRVFTDRYDKLVLAMGSANLVPRVPGSDRVGVQTLKSVEDLLFLKEYTRTPYVRDIVILGGSYSGLEIAKAFVRMGRKVRIIEKERQLLPSFDAEVSAKIQTELEANGVQINLGETATAFPGQSFIEKVQTNRGSYDCDLCIVAIGVAPNPTVDIVNECIAAARSLNVDLLVALGGGSAIDTAKATSIVVANGGSVEQYEGVDKSAKPGIPIVAINTTAGTGSECTTFYIVTDPVRHSKMTMVDTNCTVAIAVNDIEFMLSMPPKLTAATGMDALTHAIEAVLSTGANPLTDKDALWAIRAIVKNLPVAVANGSDEGARTMMAYAENVAGMAFSNAGLGMVHTMAHALGGHYNLPHGVCNAVLLPYVLSVNSASPEVKSRCMTIATAMGLRHSFVPTQPLRRKV